MIKMIGCYFVVLSVFLMSFMLMSSAECLPVSSGQTKFEKGNYEVTTDVVFDDPVVFEDGAVLSVAKGVTVTFNNSFTAGEGQVFAGEGNIRGLRKLTPEWFGAKGDGITDDTAAFQKALDTWPRYGIEEYQPKMNFVLHLRKNYLLSSVSVNAHYVTIDSSNAWLIAQKTGDYPYLLRFLGHSCTVVGNLNIEGSYNLGYECMINVNARHFYSHNVRIWRANLGWRFGSPEYGITNDAPGMSEKGDSEIEIIGGATVHCLRGIEAIGSNTIITFTDALIYSFPPSLPNGDPRREEWLKADTTLIRCYGALVYITGGGLANFSADTPMIEVQPLKNTMRQYFSNYGSVCISNTHIEAGNLFSTANPHGIRQLDYNGVVEEGAGNTVALRITGCGGYVGRSAIPVSTDPIFAGKIVITDCNFYGHAATTFANLANPKATIKVENETLRNKWVNGLGAIEGGSPIFENRTVLKTGIQETQTIGEQLEAIKFSNIVLTPDSTHFKDCYDVSESVFRVPEGGLDQVTVTANVVLDEDSSDVVRLVLLKNNTEITATTTSGPSGYITFKFTKLRPEDTLSIAAKTASGTRRIMVGEGTVFRIDGSRF